MSRFSALYGNIYSVYVGKLVTFTLNIARIPKRCHIGSQMCQIALSKKIKKKMRACMIFLWRGCMIFLTTVSTVNIYTYIYIYIYIYLLSNFGKSNLTYLTTNIMFSRQCFAILAMF